ncbi:HD domain-containing protein [Candidatus Uhrbacteria bacterium]|nr:HD domain-containing protein [Candidatus Uhrbacteria bacterium]
MENQENPFKNTLPERTGPYKTAELRERLFAQDERLIDAANKLAMTIRALPRDPDYPDIEPRALVVGGFARDTVLGKHPKDIDLEIYGVSPDRLESILNQLFPERVNTVGRAFGILKVSLGDGVEFDVSIPRRESKTGSGHTGFAVSGDPGMKVEEAAERRDFTMNSICADPLTGEFIDPFNGLQDIHDRVLRVTNAERFQDDPLRVYRAVQFAARMELTVEDKSLELMREMVERGDMEELSKERVLEEIKKLLLKAEKPSIGLELMRELGLLGKYFPELDALVGLPQDKEWHPEGDAWKHTLQVVDWAAKIIRDPRYAFSADEKFSVMLGALCHDLGKPAVTKEIDGRIRSIGHEEAGLEPTKALCERWGFPHDIQRSAELITTQHMKPSSFIRAFENGEMEESGLANALRKLLKKLHPMGWKELLAVCEADWRGSALPGTERGAHPTTEKFAEIVEKYKLDAEPTKPLVQGRDLIDLGIKQGKAIGNIVRRIEDMRDAGEITTREQALEKMRELVAGLG